MTPLESSGQCPPSPGALQQARIGLRVASAFFALLSGAHLIRAWSGWEIRIGAYSVGFEASAVAFLVTAGMGLWFWKLAVGIDEPRLGFPLRSPRAGMGAAASDPPASR